MSGGIKLKTHLGKLGLLIVAIIWGSGFVASQMALDSGLTPNQIMTLRFFIASVLMMAISFKKIKNASKEAIKYGVIIGMFLFIAFSFQTYGLMHTTPSKNAFITAINVVIVPFIGYLIYKRKLDVISIVSSIIAIVGIGILSLEADLSFNLGDFLTLICAVGFAMHIFFTGEFAKDHDPILLTTIQLTTAFILSAILLIFTKESDIIINAKGLGSVSYLGVFSTTIAFLLQTICQRKTTQGEAAIILSTEAIFGTILSAIILGELITLKMIIGSSLILFSIIMTETKLSFLFKDNKKSIPETV